MKFLLFKLKRYFIFLSLFLLVSCSTEQSIYKNKKPTFDLKTYFTGPVIAWGLVKDYKQQVTRRFCVEMTGTWEEEQGVNKGLLAETFYFDDGEMSFRNWQLRQLSDGSYEGTAEDVVGKASGKAEGFSFQWKYTLSLTIDDTDYEFQLDDWLYQMDKYRVFNQTDMNKFGLTVATLTLFFDKEQPIRRCEQAVKS